MSTLFVPLQMPRHAGPLFWLTFAFMLAAAWAFGRTERPRSTTAWMLLGYLGGSFYFRADWGGLAGAIVGALLGLASAALASRNRT